MTSAAFWAELPAIIGALIVAVLIWSLRSASARLNKIERCLNAKASTDDLQSIKSDIHSLERQMVTHPEFQRYQDRNELARAELRSSITRLEDKIDDLKRTVMQCMQTHMGKEQ